MDIFAFMNTNLLVDSTTVCELKSNHALLYEKESSHLLRACPPEELHFSGHREHRTFL